MKAKAKTKTGADAPDVDTPRPEATKEALQTRMEAARESLSQTVEQIRDTVGDQYASVKAGVSGILDWREGFQREPILWSVGALSAGFAIGYTLGVAQKGRGRRGVRSSALGAFVDGLVGELKKTGSSLPLLSLDPQVRALFGFGLSDVLAEIGGAKESRRPGPPKRKRRSPRKVGRARRE